MGTRSLSHEESGHGVALTTHSYLAPRFKTEYRYIPTLFLGFMTRSRVKFTF
jgi:hypothetical protein